MYIKIVSNYEKYLSEVRYLKDNQINPQDMKRATKKNVEEVHKGVLKYVKIRKNKIDKALKI